MRMDPAQPLDARVIVNEWPEERLAAIFREYGEERYARRIAREVVRRRRKVSLETTTELVDAIKRAVPVPAQFGAGHPARRVFQAIRIAVNEELGSLERALPQAWDAIRPGGRMAVISFHSLEDRRVKQFLARPAPRPSPPTGPTRRARPPRRAPRARGRAARPPLGRARPAARRRGRRRWSGARSRRTGGGLPALALPQVSLPQISVPKLPRLG